MASDDLAPAVLRQLPSWLLTQSAMQAHRIITEAFTAGDARGYHFRLLATLVEFGPASQASLGRRTGIDRSDVVAAINELSTAGHVERSPDPTDARRNIITLTPTGHTQYQTLLALVTEAQTTLFAPLTPTERTTLTRLLTKVLDHHQGETS